MIMISSDAGVRMARARESLRRAQAHRPADGARISAAIDEYCRACDAVADELLEQGFHSLGGDEDA